MRKSTNRILLFETLAVPSSSVGATEEKLIFSLVLDCIVVYSRGSRQSAYPSRRLCSGAWMFWILCTIDFAVAIIGNVCWQTWRRVALVAWGCPHSICVYQSLEWEHVIVFVNVRECWLVFVISWYHAFWWTRRLQSVELWGRLRLPICVSLHNPVFVEQLKVVGNVII